MAKVLLLNPPVGKRSVLRDFACGESAKANYYWAPIDLLVLSGILSSDHELMVVDCAVGNTPSCEVLHRIKAFLPDVVFSLTAAVSIEVDAAVLEQIKSETGARIYGLGDVASFAPAETLSAYSVFDGLIQNFADPSLNSLAEGDLSAVTSVVLRTSEGIEHRDVCVQTPMRYDMPKHGLFPTTLYRMPFTNSSRTTTVLSVYGCPFNCTFCPSCRLPFQEREIGDLVEELLDVERMGIEEVYLRDFTFGPSRLRAHKICQAIRESNLSIEWSAECRIDLLDGDLLQAMYDAGCRVILVGIETGAASTASTLGKPLDKSAINQILKICSKLGIRTCGHFVLGVPGETREQIFKTIRFARGLPLDFAAFNMYAARLGTPMRKQLEESGQLGESTFMGQDVSLHAGAYAAVPPSELAWLLRVAVMSFYSHPQRLVRLMKNTPWETLLRQGRSVLVGLLEVGQ